MKNTFSIVASSNLLQKLKANKVLNKLSTCAKYAQRFLSLGLGLLIAFGNQLWISDWGVRAVAERSAARGPRFYDGLAETSDRGFIWTQKLLLIC